MNLAPKLLAEYRAGPRKGTRTPESYRAEDLTGRAFGRWTVLSRAPNVVDRAGHARVMWNVQCACGSVRAVQSAILRNGNSQSCGCISRERMRAMGISNLRHGHTAGKQPDGQSIHTHEYRSWKGIIQRCTNPARRSWKDYGGRGVTVCAAWRDFACFIADIGTAPSPAHSVDRVDPNGNYEPGNCRWATRREQANNTRRTRFLTLPDGRRVSRADYARETGQSYWTVRGMDDRARRASV